MIRSRLVPFQAQVQGGFDFLARRVGRGWGGSRKGRRRSFMQIGSGTNVGCAKCVSIKAMYSPKCANAEFLIWIRSSMRSLRLTVAFPSWPRIFRICLLKFPWQFTMYESVEQSRHPHCVFRFVCQRQADGLARQFCRALSQGRAPTFRQVQGQPYRLPRLSSRRSD